MCGFCNMWVCVCVGFVICGCVYVMDVLTILWVFVYYVYFYLLCFVLFHLCIFMFICFGCTSLRTTATE
jgi:hypothetical protein